MRLSAGFLVVIALIAPWFGCSAVSSKPTFDSAVVENSPSNLTLGFDLRDDNAPKAGLMIRPEAATGNSVNETRLVMLPFETYPAFHQAGLLSMWGSSERCCTVFAYLAAKGTAGSYLIPLSPIIDPPSEDPTALPGQLYLLKHGLERKFIYKYKLGDANLDEDTRKFLSSVPTPGTIAIATPRDAEWKEIAPGTTESPSHTGENSVARFFPGVTTAGVDKLQLRYALPLSANAQLGLKVSVQLIVAVSPPLVILYFLRQSAPRNKKLRRITIMSALFVESCALLYIGWLAYSARTVDTMEAGLSAGVCFVGTVLSVATAYLSNRPHITIVLPSAATVGTTVTIVGSNFGASQGTGAVTFNGVSATPKTWSDDTIVTDVPSGASTGKVVVTIEGVPSNGVPFTVA